MPNDETQADKDFRRVVRRKSFFAFACFFALIMVASGIGYWLVHQPQEDGAGKFFRRVLDFNSTVNAAYSSPNHKAKSFNKSQAVANVRVNGDLGMNSALDTSAYKLRVVNQYWGADSVLELTMADLKKLPKTDVVFDFKCIEGWSQVTHWGGVRLSDFMQRYKLGSRDGQSPDINRLNTLANYIGLVTPDHGYYVGIDMKSALQPQTILCYEMNGQPLPMNQGAPLRLIIPVKYGIKHLKRIGTLRFVDKRPADFWFEQGYDYDAAL